MRPIRLQISGLHSFREEVTIDFNELSQAGVFGIFGPTGSGKSSILDAITLALYGTVGRAGRGTQGILNHAEKSLTVSFDFAIGNAAERQCFRVERRYKRNGEVNVLNAYSRLSILEEDTPYQVLADKASEVTAKVEEILGLELDDFTRAVVLPQGKFAEFLHLKGKDRSVMLQRLFSLEQYGDQLTARLNKRQSHINEKHLEVASIQLGLGDASKEAVAQAEQQWKADVQAELQAQLALETARISHKQAEQIKAWQDEWAGILAKVQIHNLQAEEIEKIKAIIETSVRAEKVISFVTATDEAVSEERIRKTEHEAFAVQIEQVKAELLTACEAYEQARKEREGQEPELIAQQSKLEAAQEVEDQLGDEKQQVLQLQEDLELKRAEQQTVATANQNLQQRKDAVEANREETKTWLEQSHVTSEYREAVYSAKQKADQCMQVEVEQEQATSDLQARQQELAGREQELATAQAAFVEVFARLQALQDSVTALQPPTDVEAISKEQLLLFELRAKAQQVAEKEAEQEKLSLSVAVKEQELAQLTERATVADEALRMAQELVTDVRKQHTALMLQDKQALATRLAVDLTHGEQCPVCGSLEHPDPAHGDEQASDRAEQLAELERAFAQAEQEEANKRTEATQLGQQKLQVETQVQGAQEQLATVTELLVSMRGALLQSVLQTNSALGDADEMQGILTGEEIVAWLDRHLQRIEKEKAQCKVWEEARQHARSELQTLQTQLNEQKVRVATSEEKVKAAQSERERAQTALDEKVTRTVEAKRVRDEALTGLDAIDIKSALADLKAKEEAEQRAKELLKQFEEDIKQVEAQLVQDRERENLFTVDVKVKESTLTEQQKQMKDKESKLLDLTQGRQVADLRDEVLQKLTLLKAQVETTKQAYEQKGIEKTEVEQKLTHANALLEQAVQRLGKCRHDVQTKLHEYHFPTTGDVQDALLPPSELQEKQQNVQTYQEQGNSLLAGKSGLEEKLQGHELSAEQWEHIVQKLQTAMTELQEATGACGAAKERYEELQKRHVQWAALEEKRLQLAEELSRLNELKKVMRGTDFVEFLAKEQLDYVARQASERLKQLTRNRYGLEVDSEAGFIMRDDANGGVKRPVSTLSGGETFLTSLALALSLSSQIQLRGQYPLEFFFLDEGFGTLDPELLEVVMSALERLNLDNMTIGVISHVPELRQRMNRRLIVEPAEAAGRGSRVRMEGA